MAAVTWEGAPFGIQSARFSTAGAHPKWKTPGSMTQIAYSAKGTDLLLGPGKYDLPGGDFCDKALAEKARGPGWARAHEVEKMSRIPHLLYKEEWERKKLQEKMLGPGTYEYQDFLYAGEQKPRSTRGIMQTRDRRFQASDKFGGTPGPGTYGEGGIPQQAVDEKKKQSPGTVGMLECGGNGSRTLPMVGTQLGPGTYNTSNGIDQIINKRVSTRGPYDLFTAERGKPIKTGHYAVLADYNLGPGEYGHGTFTDHMRHYHNKKKGKFGKVAQYPVKSGERNLMFTLAQQPRNPGDPAPCHYDPKLPGDFHYEPVRRPGFGSSAPRNDRRSQQFFTRNFNPVGAGRYDIQKHDDSRHVNGHIGVFKSKTQRPNHATSKFLKERMRPKDLRPEDKPYNVEPLTPRNSVRDAAQMSSIRHSAQIAAAVV